MKAIHYHVTPSAQLPSIRTHGLLPSIGARSRAARESQASVFLFSDPDAVEDALMGWLGDEFPDEPLTLLVLDVSGLPLDTSLHSFESRCDSVIPACRILSARDI
ncbi:hypothetical protein E4T66_18595 [Sinimarinibacterium sp. CAU 1509]|uniref:hypothetical protein n=1 Tax=Sinimarinibacterium sp. CAU 1509 TaxID=2562283 RepID=UPI0010ACFCFC|nr:hypothetical protein [Sinimarinibacterium sp. CAU 1509]TJY57417.1 hypothetical protein E4T66_18595 [Sinimarinibacterium sp. CAU 1509]